MKLLVPGKAREEREKKARKVTDRHVLADAGGQRQFAGVDALVDDADADEQRAGGDAVVDHHQEGALEPPGVEHEDAEGDKAHVGDAGVGDQLLQVALGQGGEAAVDDADDGQPQDTGAKSMVASGVIGRQKRRKP